MMPPTVAPYLVVWLLFAHARVAGENWISDVTPVLNESRVDIPLEFLLGWIDVESGGRNTEVTSLGERGYFQIHPDESSELGLDHRRLSSDPKYSITSGITLVNYYAGVVTARGYSRGTDLFWHLVKFYHAIGSGAASDFLDDMKTHGVDPNSWSAIREYATANEKRLHKKLKHDPAKWVRNVDDVFARGHADLHPS